MHLTFVSTEGLEGSAVSFLTTSRIQEGARKRMTFDDTDCPDDSDRESGFLIIDENSPLLLNLDPPGTRVRGDVSSGKRKGYSSLLNFKIRRNSSNSKGLPFVVLVTGLGMAVMVLLGLFTMFQEPAAVPVPTNIPVVIEEFSSNNASAGSETTEAPAPVAILNDLDNNLSPPIDTSSASSTQLEK